jgi:valyl-tRNA synthetase
MSTPQTSKVYEPKRIEGEVYALWEANHGFDANVDDARPSYCIMIPLPNVTGALHMGHALNNSLQDILIRRKRMAGFSALWMPGTDHAGIATQAVVEKLIFEREGKSRHDLGRDELVRRIWAWKDEYGGRILAQQKRMGCSCDWRRVRFTLDEVCTRAVRRTFFRMFADGLVFRGKRLVNWDAQLQTAVSDDEIFHETVRGHMWHMRYPLSGGGGHLAVATTRPETMLGDTAVAVHPDDDRYKAMIGGTVDLPLTGRRIPIIADGELVDPAFGTGCVKVTPAHDPNDYECGQRNGLEMINILNPDGTINENGGPYQGLDRYEARRRVVEDLEKQGLLEKVEDYETEIGHSDRSKTPIEPYLSDQWFIRTEQLATAAMEAVESGRVQIFPPRYTRTYLDWLAEKRDWCISRQLWWGHRIPIWHCATCSEADLKAALGGREDVCWRADALRGGWLICAEQDLPADALGDAHKLVQEDDVLDTWFSSALWPHSTLGWPQHTGELGYFYPTSVLVTSRDIITLWVARMVMTGLYNMDEVPFDHVYVHAKILDGEGQTMSKSKGNGVDPVDVIELYGADALRFTLAAMTTETQDVRLPVAYFCPYCEHLTAQKPKHRKLNRMNCPSCRKEFAPNNPMVELPEGLPIGRLVSEKFQLGRNFCNKLYNAVTGVAIPMLAEQLTDSPLFAEDLRLEDRWILSRLTACIEQVSVALDEYRYSEAANTAYHFVWDELCDWYLELIKPKARGEAAPHVAARVLGHCVDAVLRLLHPICPFITEALWQQLGKAAPNRTLAGTPAEPMLITAAWPEVDPERTDEQAETQMAFLQMLIRKVRDIRNHINASRSADGQPSVRQIGAKMRCDGQVGELVTANLQAIRQLGSLSSFQVGPDVRKPPACASEVIGTSELFVPLGDLVNVESERKRLAGRIEAIESRAAGVRKKLANERFVQRAPAEVVQRERDNLAGLEAEIAGLRRHLEDLG